MTKATTNSDKTAKATKATKPKTIALSDALALAIARSIVHKERKCIISLEDQEILKQHAELKHEKRYLLSASKFMNSHLHKV